MAMVLQDMVAAGAPIRFSILGTDISTEVLKTARTGDLLPRSSSRRSRRRCRQRYFLRAKDPAASTRPRSSRSCAGSVQFERLNLMDETIRSTATSTSSSAATS